MNAVDFRKLFGEADKVGPVGILRGDERLVRSKVGGDGMEHGDRQVRHSFVG